MSLEEKIADLNKRMAGHYLPDGNETNVIAVCLFVATDTNLVQGWFSRFDESGYRCSKVNIEDFIAEGRQVSDVLSALEEYVNITDEVANSEIINALCDGEKIIEEIGFGD
jgi:hypothetical protein